MKRMQHSFQTGDNTTIQFYHWYMEGNENPKAIIQIAHGMAEHVLRYEPFCAFLVENGFAVYGNDHRGHGQSGSVRGFFSVKNGFGKTVNDMKQLTNIIQTENPGVPIILFGHSMGSFLTRRYIQLYGNDISGVILSGTGGNKGIVGKVGLIIAKFERMRKGAQTPSPLLDKLTFGSFNNQFKPIRTKFDFLSRDEVEVDTYIADPLCGFICSAGFFVDLISGIELIHQENEVAKVPKHLPIYLISGDKDPVGNDGKDVKKVYEEYKKHHLENVQITLYENARHELLNETNKAEVYQDVLKFLQE